MRNAFLLSVAMMVMGAGCVGPQTQVGASMSMRSADGRIIVDSMPNLVTIPAGNLDIGAGGALAAYVIDRSTNLCYFWTTTSFGANVWTSGILIDCCRLRKIPAAVAVFRTMIESCDGSVPAAPSTPAPAAR